MALEQQWQEDVKLFGQLAYLMWEIKKYYGNRHYGFYQAASNDEVLYAEKYCIFEEIARRKQSASLPFNLAATRAGDAVEILTCNEWLDCSNDYALYLYNNEGHDNKNSKTHLRMKHPRRIGVDYSQF